MLYFSGAFFVERLAERFDNLHRDGKEDYGQGKECLNVVSLFAHLYNFKVRFANRGRVMKSQSSYCDVDTRCAFDKVMVQQ